MSKYLVIATSYYAHTVLFASDYVLSDKDCEFLLLKENHSELDFKNKRVTLYDSIEGAVYDCDYVWIIDSGLKSGIYGKVAVIANKHKKKLIFSQIDFEKTNNVDLFQKQLFHNKPTILSIGIGESSQQYCTEIFLNEMLRKRGIDFDHLFSSVAQTLLVDIAKNKLVNRELVKQIFNPQYRGDLCVKGITFKNHSDFLCSVNEIKSWMADIIILNLNQNIASNSEIIDSLNNCFERPMFFFCSQYLEVENNIPRTLFVRSNQCYDIPMISNEGARLEMENKIISQLSFPRHVYKII